MEEIMNIFFAEFIGTMLLILLGNGCVANVLLKSSKGENSGWIVITAGWGFAVAVAIYVVGWASGAHINSAVTFALCIAGKVSWDNLPFYVIGQMLGAMIGALLVWAAYYTHFGKTDNIAFKLMCFSTKPAIRRPFSNFITEVIATAVLLIGVMGIFDVHSKVNVDLIPYLVGILVFAIGLSLGGPTGFAINPARDLGPRLIHAFFPIQGKGSSEWNYAWIPVFGPLVGGALGVLLYQTCVAWLTPLSP
jgi:glycerol uptake facilitator